MSLKRYRLLDCGILLLIMALLEGLIAFGRGLYPGEAYMLSTVLPVTLIVIMRWGMWGLIHGIVGGVLYAFLYGGGRGAAVYGLGNLGICLGAVFLLKTGKEKVRGDVLFTIIYCVLGWLGTGLGKSISSMIASGYGFMDMARLHLAVEAFNGAAAIIIVLIARKQNGVFEDQPAFLARTAEEEKRKKGEA
ncbi:MAG: hypothetical protein LBS19_13965 [Clostridiales bacterium]|jgi:hypothetical protein|nr:hypothetical protein [Clostridiales bacterium]